MVLAAANYALLIFLLCLLLFDIAHCKTFNIDRLVRTPRQTKRCSDYEFQCKSGECISDISVCDGKENCRDGSDELNCDKIPCPAYAFRCNYGACINKNLVCDGKKDCKDNSDETDARCEQKTATPQKTCGDFQYRCSTGQCIKEDSVCDGKADCGDHSDESQNICSSLRCAQFNFRCAYGACINSKGKCDGKLDCIDGSDELPTLCNKTPVVTPGPDVVTPTNAPPGEGCTVPQHPANGRYELFGLNTPISPGNRVIRGTAVQIICDDRYRTVPNIEFVICRGTQWSNTFPECHITCTSIQETESMYANCTYKNIPVNCEQPVFGTRAKFTCKDLYEDLNSVLNPNRVCGDDGTWDDRFPNCIARCGRKSVDAQALIVGGKKVRKGDYPWQAAIYDKDRNNMNICGGTIISMKTIVSAAHCFAKNTRGNALNPASRYKIGVGKYYLGFSDPRDAMAQYSEIKRIMVPTRYTGRTNQYSFDVAVVILEQKITLSIVVQPICVDWTNVLEAEQLRPNSYGVVTGWGLTTSGGVQSEELKELSVPYVPDGECLQNLREDFKPYFTVDKMCSGFLQNGSSACEGDSGGGLAFPSRDNRYYLRGVVSVAPKGPFESCDADEYTLYTKVSQHIDFISEVDSLARSL